MTNSIDRERAEFGRNETVIEKGFYILPSQLFFNINAKAKNDYNIALSSYVKQKEHRVAVDATELDTKFEVIVARLTELRRNIYVIVKDLEGK